MSGPGADMFNDFGSAADRPVPAWWNAAFLLTMLLAGGYGLYFHLSPMALSPTQRWSSARTVAMERMFAQIDGIELSDEKMLMLMGDAKWLGMGERLFTLRCAQCHGADGEGFLGPNLTDDAYKNVRALTDIVGVITDGAGGGTMPAQRGVLSESQITVVAVYVASLRGKNLASPRPAEGGVIPAWPKGGERP